MAPPVDPKQRSIAVNPPIDGEVSPNKDGGQPSVESPPDFWGDRNKLGEILAGEPPAPDPQAKNNKPKITPKVRYNPDTKTATGSVTGVFPAGSINVAKLTAILSGNDDAGLKKLMGPSAKAGGGKSSYQTGTDDVPFSVFLTATFSTSGNTTTIISHATGEVDPKNPTLTTNDSTYTITVAADGSTTVELKFGAQKLKMDHLPKKKRDDIDNALAAVQDSIEGQMNDTFRDIFKTFHDVAPK